MLEKLKPVYVEIFPKDDGTEYSKRDVKLALAWWSFLSVLLFLISIRAGIILFPLAIPFYNSKITHSN
jgi:hypothetical protein